MEKIPMTTKKDIKGVPYAITPNEWGFRVTANGNPTDRFYRSYQVYVAGGRAVRCSCPHQVHRGGECKHMTAANGIIAGSVPVAKLNARIEADFA
jgi:hypothetical protein